MGKLFLHGRSMDKHSIKNYAKLTVNCPQGVVVRVSSDQTSRSFEKKSDSDGKAVFDRLAEGFWDVTFTNIDNAEPQSIEIGSLENEITMNFSRYIISVSYPVGSTCTIAKDGVSYTAKDTSGSFLCYVNEAGTYNVTISRVHELYGEQSASGTITVTELEQIESISLKYFEASINITYPAGSSCIVTNGDLTLNATDNSGTWNCVVPSAGTWNIFSSDGDKSASATVEIESDGQSASIELTYTYIYGIYRDITASSPDWAREDDAAGKTVTASVGTTAGASDFDSCYPWSGIQRETLSTGDVMVKIPKFYFQRYREGNIEHIKISNKPSDGFTLHPAFNHASVEKDFLYVGAYKTSSNNKSVSGASPTVSQARATMRTNAVAKGDGWSLIDISAVSAIQMLILVEFATNDVQTAIGRGYCDGNSVALNAGSCDGVTNLTGRPSGTDGKVDVVWRGIEGFWGNVWERVDGCNWNGGTYYICSNPSNYADDTATNYTALSFNGATNWSSSYITQVGLDTGSNPNVMLPSAAGSGSASTYQCDGVYSSTGWRVLIHGGSWDAGSLNGLFTASLDSASSGSYPHVGSRLQYIPQ